MTALREVFAHFGVNFDTSNLDRGASTVSRLTRGLGALGVTLSAGAVAIGVQRFVSNMVEVGDELDKAAIRTGLSTRALQEWRHVADLGGTSAGDLGIALRTLQRTSDDAAHGGSETAEAFRRLGVSVNDSSGNLRSVDELLLDVGDALDRTENSGERTALAMKVLGRGGNSLLPMFVGGREAMQEMRAELERLGGGSSQQMIDQAVELNDDLARMRLSFMSVKSAIAVHVLPAVNRTVEWLTTLGGAMTRVADNSHILETAFMTLGAVAVTAGVATIGTWGPIVATLAAVAIGAALVALAFDDIWVTVEGGDSLLRRLLEWQLGASRAAEAVRNLQQGIDDLRMSWEWVQGALGIEAPDMGTREGRARQRGANVREVITSGRPITTAARQEWDWRQTTTRQQTEALRWRNDRPMGTGERVLSPEARADYGTGGLLGIERQPAFVASSGPKTTTVNAPMDVRVTIQQATDVAEVDRRVRTAIREAGEEQRREILGATDEGESS